MTGLKYMSCYVTPVSIYISEWVVIDGYSFTGNDSTMLASLESPTEEHPIAMSLAWVPVFLTVMHSQN